jgi:hypothetical protein
LVLRPGILIDEDDSFVVKDEPFDGLRDGRTGNGWYFLCANIVEASVAGVGVLAAGDGPDAVSSKHQLIHNLQVRGSVVLNELEALFGAFFEGLSGLSPAHAVDGHGVLDADRVILRVDEHDLAFQKLIAVLDEHAAPLLSWVLQIALRNREFLVNVSRFPEVAAQDVEDVGISRGVGDIGEDAGVGDGVEVFRVVHELPEVVAPGEGGDTSG